ncbi:EF-hand domain-containing protein [bacterium]|nr:EF-hand domain-containing protein [bacterium]
MASSGASIISNLTSNLSNTYSYLASLYPDEGVTIKNITKARNDNTNYLTLNQSFASYLQNNFSTLDKDGDGVISADEMNKMTNTLSTAGVSKAELTQLAASGAYSGDMINKILENFDEMDTNHDGRVTSAEISSFSYSCNKQEKIDEENYKKATGISVFYGDDSASEPSSYSILSYRYKNYNSNK